MVIDGVILCVCVFTICFMYIFVYKYIIYIVYQYQSYFLIHYHIVYIYIDCQSEEKQRQLLVAHAQYSVILQCEMFYFQKQNGKMINKCPDVQIGFEWFGNLFFAFVQPAKSASSLLLLARTDYPFSLLPMWLATHL